MKVDYKSTFKQLRFPVRFRLHVTRNLIRFILGGVAILCLIIGVTSRHSTSPNVSPSLPLVAQDGTVIPLPLPSSNASTITNSTTSSLTTLTNATALPLSNSEATDTTHSLSLSLSPVAIATKLAPDNIISPTPAVPTPDSLKEKLKKEAEKPIWRVLKVQKGDTLAKIFKRNGYQKQDLTAILASASAKKHLTSLNTRKTLKILVGDARKIHGLSIDISPGNTLSLSRKESSGEKPAVFLAENIQVPVKKQLAFGKGLIKSGSLFSAAKNAGLDKNLVTQMVTIFGWNKNFVTKLKPNDSFRVLFEEKRLDGERIETGTILAAEIVNAGKKHMAIRYTDKSGRTGYFSPEGHGMNQIFVTPVNFTRISSAFGRRAHPVYHKIREHKGIDYCAPAGTPVQATADAKVVFVGTRGGYGKVIELQHGARYSTLYAHLSRFEKKISVGTEIKQGQIIGYVGRTGLATGDHLHYEFRIDGIHRDPLSTGLLRKNPISDSNKHHFLAHAKEVMRLMDLHEHKVNVVRNEYR